MEDVLDVYTRDHDPDYPVVCFDETPKQLISEVIEKIPMAPGQPERQDYLYTREGVCNIFMMFAPLENWRHVEVTDRRTAKDYAHQMKDLVDQYFPSAKKIRVVQDQLNTHRPASLYKAFPPEEAQRILAKIEFHYTPKHGSWLNMAEIELSVLSRQCLNYRIATKEEVEEKVRSWEEGRNQKQKTVEWRFTTPDARIKLRRLYPLTRD